jgi:hypothetical protein
MSRPVVCAEGHKPKLFAVMHPDGTLEIKHRDVFAQVGGATLLRVYCPLCRVHRELRL